MSTIPEDTSNFTLEDWEELGQMVAEADWLAGDSSTDAWVALGESVVEQAAIGSQPGWDYKAPTTTTTKPATVTTKPTTAPVPAPSLPKVFPAQLDLAYDWKKAIPWIAGIAAAVGLWWYFSKR